MTKIRCLHNCRDYLLKFKPQQYTSQLKVMPLYFQPHMGSVVTKWATQWLVCSTTLHTVEAIEQFVNILDKMSRRQVLTADHPYKKHKHMSSSILVSLSQLANLKKMFKTIYQVTLE